MKTLMIRESKEHLGLYYFVDSETTEIVGGFMDKYSAQQCLKKLLEDDEYPPVIIGNALKDILDCVYLPYALPSNEGYDQFSLDMYAFTEILNFRVILQVLINSEGLELPAFGLDANDKHLYGVLVVNKACIIVGLLSAEHAKNVVCEVYRKRLISKSNKIKLIRDIRKVYALAEKGYIQKIQPVEKQNNAGSGFDLKKARKKARFQGPEKTREEGDMMLN